MNSEQRSQRIWDLHRTLDAAGYPHIAMAAAGAPSNWRHFAGHSDKNRDYRAPELRLIAELEELHEALGIKLPRRRNGMPNHRDLLEEAA
jgi:hypothetical protein